MASLHIQHLKNDIDQYLNLATETTQKIGNTTPKAILDYLKEQSTVKLHFALVYGKYGVPLSMSLDSTFTALNTSDGNAFFF
jgi:hypothetical protein